MSFMSNLVSCQIMLFTSNHVIHGYCQIMLFMSNHVILVTIHVIHVAIPVIPVNIHVYLVIKCVIEDIFNKVGWVGFQKVVSGPLADTIAVGRRQKRCLSCYYFFVFKPLSGVERQLCSF
jgi:hypothetical protein